MQGFFSRYFVRTNTALLTQCNCTPQSSVIDDAKEGLEDAEDAYEKAKDVYEKAKNTTEDLEDAYNTAPSEWTSAQKWGVGIGVAVAAFIACCLLFKFVPCLKCFC